MIDVPALLLRGSAGVRLDQHAAHRVARGFRVGCRGRFDVVIFLYVSLVLSDSSMEPKSSCCLRLSPLEHCAVEQVDDFQSLCSVAQIRVIQLRLDEDDPQDVTPLPIGNLVPRTIPVQLLEEDVLGSVEIQVASGVGCHLYSLPPVHLLLIEDGTTYDEQVDFH